MRYSIYTLFDIITGLRFYVGCTFQSLSMRLSAHRAALAGNKDMIVYDYIKANNVQFDIVEIDRIVCPLGYPAAAYALEQSWIDFLTGEGYMLFNTHRTSFNRQLPNESHISIENNN